MPLSRVACGLNATVRSSPGCFTNTGLSKTKSAQADVVTEFGVREGRVG